MIELTAYRGDSMSFTIPLTNGAAAFTPGGSYSLIFTAKRSSKDPDTAAVFQKSTATGTITTSTTNAIVTVLYTDTTTEDEPVLYWDIQAQHNSTAAVITAAKGTLTLVRDITRQTTASVPIYTVDPAAGNAATPAGSTGSVQINNAGALAADSGLVFTGTGNTGVLKVGRGQIAINALPYSGGTLASNIGIGFNPITPTSNAILTNNVQGNIGIGDNALDLLNTADGYNTNNIAIGTFALSSLDTCQASIFIGTYAGMNLTADSNSSTIIGDAAGVYYGGAGYLSLTQAAGCIFLGRLTRGSAAVSSNQIVIGNAAIGDQNNSTVIGNTNTTQTRLAGNTLKLGSSALNTSIAQTATGSSKTITLPNVTGKLPVYTDTPVAGRVLTATDDSGAATWLATGAGTVTSITAGTGLSGGTITTTGTIALANTTVTAQAYTNANITVDAQGRITAAANGSTAGNVTGTAPIVVTSGAVSLDTTLPDVYAFTNVTRPTAVNTSAPASNSLMTYNDVLNLTLRDARTYYVNYPMGTTASASGGTSSASRGYWQLFTSTTASSKAQVFFDVSALLGTSSVINFDRRMILNTKLPTATLRSGLQYYCQVGRTVSDGTAAQLTKKGFGYGQSGSTITPFVHNGTSITNGTTFSATTYPFITMDFVAGVALYVYGQTLTSTTPVLLATISTGLPSGNSASADGQLEFLIYDTGSGGGNNWFYLGSASMTIL